MDAKLHRQFLTLAGEFSPQMQDHIKRLGPVTIPNRKHLGIAHFLAQIIIGQQLSTKAAHTIWSRIKGAARDADQRIPQFFSAENTATLRACGASGNKAKALLAIHDAHREGRLSSTRLRRLDFDTRCNTLLEIRGVGQWTVDMASMFYFGETDIWPDGDLSVARTFRSYLNAKQLRKEEKILAEFSPHRSYLAMYMWKIVGGVP